MFRECVFKKEAYAKNYVICGSWLYGITQRGKKEIPTPSCVHIHDVTVLGEHIHSSSLKSVPHLDEPF